MRRYKQQNWIKRISKIPYCDAAHVLKCTVDLTKVLNTALCSDLGWWLSKERHRNKPEEHHVTVSLPRSVFLEMGFGLFLILASVSASMRPSYLDPPCLTTQLSISAQRRHTVNHQAGPLLTMPGLFLNNFINIPWASLSGEREVMARRLKDTDSIRPHVPAETLLGQLIF